MTRRFLLIALAALAAAPAARAQQASSAAATTVILVRHAEAVPNAGTDPALTEAGQARALALAAALKDASVKAVFTTQYQRTIKTGEPLASAANAELVTRPVSGPLDPYVTQIVNTVFTKYAGSTVVIVGHSNTIPALVKGFSGVDPGEIAHDSYDSLYVVTTTGPGSGRLVRARFGAR